LVYLLVRVSFQSAGVLTHVSFAGKLFDKGHLASQLILGTILFSVGMFALSVADTTSYYQVLLSQGVAYGIGIGFLYAPAIACTSRHWINDRALAIGIATSGSSLGGIAYPIMLNHFFSDSIGFAWGVRISAFISLALLVVGGALVIAGDKYRRKDIKEAVSSKIDLKAMFADVAFWLAVAG
jgi:MFS family permease